MHDGIKTPLDRFELLLPLCCCGTDKPQKLLLKCLRWSALPHEDPKKAEELPNGFYKSTAYELSAKVLDMLELIEHGTGIGWAWITPLGREVLAFVDQKDEA